MNTAAGTRTVAGFSVLFTASLVALFFTPEQIERPVNVVVTHPITTEQPIGWFDGPEPLEPSIDDKKILEETKQKLHDQTTKLQEVLTKNKELTDEYKKVNTELMQIKKEMENKNRVPSDVGKGKEKRKPRPIVLPDNPFAPYIKYISKRGITYGWAFDVINAITGYTVALMLIRNIWDFFNPDVPQNPELVKKKLGQLARSASIRGSLKKSSLRVSKTELEPSANPDFNRLTLEEN